MGVLLLLGNALGERFWEGVCPLSAVSGGKKQSVSDYWSDPKVGGAIIRCYQALWAGEIAVSAKCSSLGMNARLVAAFRQQCEYY